MIESFQPVCIPSHVARLSGFAILPLAVPLAVQEPCNVEACSKHVEQWELTSTLSGHCLELRYV